MSIKHWLFGEADTRPHERGPNGARRRKYTGEELRAIRAAKGVGKSWAGHDRDAPHINAWVLRCFQVNEMYARWLYARLMRLDPLTWVRDPDTGSIQL